MKFDYRQFSKRFPAIECAVFVIHEPPQVPSMADCMKHDPVLGSLYPEGNNHWLYRGTAAAIILPDGRFWVGVCLCSPSDQFVKVTGRNKAIGRAFVKYLASQRHWQEYLSTHGEAAYKLPITEFSQGQIDSAPDAMKRLTACLRVEIDAAKKRAVAR